MINQEKASVPFVDNDNFQVIYENDCFKIASGNVKRDNNLISVGVRWSVSTIGGKNNPNGFPLMKNENGGFTKCWLIVPNHLAIGILASIKDSHNGKTDEVYKVLKIIVEQEQKRIKDSQ